MKTFKGKLIFVPADRSYWLVEPSSASTYLTQAYGPPGFLKGLLKKKLVEVSFGKESYSIRAVD